ncbi:hypothetical protein EV183_001368 [Coemansia sp. RSA 2336]|nr:hypothetical protein EV183_001368 [Coemansia sp. RSA 2336]
MTKTLSSMSICDASGSEFLPDNCIPSPTTEEQTSMESFEPAHVRLHVMPTPTNVLIKRSMLDHSDTRSEWSSSSSMEEDDLAWSGIDGEIGNVFAGLLHSKAEESLGSGLASSETESGSSSQWFWDIGTATSIEASGESQGSAAVEWDSHLESSGLQGGLGDDLEWASSSYGETSSSSQQASAYDGSQESIDDGSQQSIDDGSQQANSLSSKQASSFASSQEESTYASNQQTSSFASIEKESAYDSSQAESSYASQATYSEISSNAQDSGSHETSFPQSTLISVIEEPNAGPFQDTNGMPVGVVGAREECAVGSFRCTDDKRGFDTCVYGRWGTIRMCSQGTSCIPVDGGTIACA